MINNKKNKVKIILSILEKKFGNPKCALNYKTPFE
ncbi:MAG: endonuclease III, partial [Fusobacterium sp.]